MKKTNHAPQLKKDTDLKHILMVFFLQVRNALSDTAGMQSAEQLSHLISHVECEHPKEDLYR